MSFDRNFLRCRETRFRFAGVASCSASTFSCEWDLVTGMTERDDESELDELCVIPAVQMGAGVGDD